MYYICYFDGHKDVFIVVYGEDAMQQKVYEICQKYDYDESEVHVFNAEDEL